LTRRVFKTSRQSPKARAGEGARAKWLQHAETRSGWKRDSWKIGRIGEWAKKTESSAAFNREYAEKQGIAMTWQEGRASDGERAGGRGVEKKMLWGLSRDHAKNGKTGEGGYKLQRKSG